MFQERDIHSSHVMAPKISQKGFPVVLHRGNIENQVLVVVLLFLSRKVVFWLVTRFVSSTLIYLLRLENT